MCPNGQLQSGMICDSLREASRLRKSLKNDAVIHCPSHAVPGWHSYHGTCRAAMVLDFNNFVIVENGIVFHILLSSRISCFAIKR